MKKKNNLFMKFIIISFIIFMGLYISSISGFYESSLSNKVALTSDAIKEFEEDVLNGEVVDIKTYIENDYTDYSNKFTNLGEDVSEVVVDLFTKGFESFWDTFKVLFL